QRVSRKRAGEPPTSGTPQPPSTLSLDDGFRDSEFGAFSGIRNCRHGGNERRIDFPQMLRNIFSLVVRKHAVFLRIVDDGISREIELCFFAVDLYLPLRKRCFESVGGTFVVSTKDDGVAAFHFEAQFIVVLVNPGKLLTNRRFNGLVVDAF